MCVLKQSRSLIVVSMTVSVVEHWLVVAEQCFYPGLTNTHGDQAL